MATLVPFLRPPSTEVPGAEPEPAPNRVGRSLVPDHTAPQMYRGSLSTQSVGVASVVRERCE